MTYDKIVAIYNPNSTGNAQEKAKSFQSEARAAGIEVELSATDHPGHIAEIAARVITETDHPLLVSVSGDGSYNELINGVVAASAQHKNKRPVVAIIAAGNANDHKRTTRGDRPLVQLISSQKPRPLDLLRLRAGKLDRLAHSYIGLGITPEVAVELNRHQLNLYREISLVWRSLSQYQPVRLQRDGKTTRYANIIAANVSSMSKIIKLDPAGNQLRDGKFELISSRWHGKLRLLLHLLRLVMVGRNHAPQFKQFSFETVDAQTLIQLDGEVEKIPAGTKTTITAEPAAVLSLY